ncbi:MAG: alpha-E domain-containing protein [Chloroflexota bacterium]
MLSRVAEAIYWMSRYLERAENTARFLEVNWHLSLDEASTQEFQQWHPLIQVTGDTELFATRYEQPIKQNVIQFLTLDTEYPSSIISCLRAARENARTVRDIISIDLWEQINTLHHLIEDMAKNPEGLNKNPYDFCHDVQMRGMLLGGMADDTMPHTEGWHFFRLGRLLERADKTSRILDVKYFILLPDLNYVGTAYDDIQWAALLRTTDALTAYRQLYGRITPHQVAEFLMLNQDFPRSVLYCLIKAQQSLNSIAERATEPDRPHNPAERHLEQLVAKLSFTSIDDIFAEGLHEFTDQLQIEMNNIDVAIAEAFFGASFQVQSQQQ